MARMENVQALQKRLREPPARRYLDEAHGNEEQGVDLVLSSFLVVVQKPGPVQIAARPDFSVTPKCQKQSRKQKQRRPDITQGAEIRRKKGGEDEQSDSNQRPSGNVVIEFGGGLVGVHGGRGDLKQR